MKGVFCTFPVHIHRCTEAVLQKYLRFSFSKFQLDFCHRTASPRHFLLYTWLLQSLLFIPFLKFARPHRSQHDRKNLSKQKFKSVTTLRLVSKVDAFPSQVLAAFFHLSPKSEDYGFSPPNTRSQPYSLPFDRPLDELR